MVSIVKALLSGLSPRTAALVAAGAIAASMPLAVQAQSTDIPADAPEAPAEELPEEAPEDVPGATRAVEGSNSPIGISAGQSLLSEAESAISSQDYDLAASKLVEARKTLNQVSAHYQNLAGVFVGVDSRVTSDLRDLALQSAEVRDQSSYQLAVVYRAQDRPDLAVPLLVEVVNSQQPTRPLGQQAYQQLYELGFVGVAYESPGQ